ncbi:methenyltetrahydromethanopterin cyclohydrolase [Thioalkalivibrio sp. ALJ2]|uniref:methenyltetrahydromethanopterin cyclohydrolase n=1 Tax=Thioalkalivibrio sp. ALJ2 TaxID=1261622 RepID=UPI0009DB1B10|nr:methenyltetrahydromethanopterin cyclohydrolase [Thioalkalivibrio sp. ALJ2]
MKSTSQPETDASYALLDLNERAGVLVDALVDDAVMLRLGVSRDKAHVRIVDAGIEVQGGLEAGRRIAEICMGGLGKVSMSGTGGTSGWPLYVHVHSVSPVIACLGSQYAGWSLSHGSGKGAFSALGSGPGRVLARKEALFAELGIMDRASRACLVMEVDRPPPSELTAKIAADCGVQPEHLTLILTPTRSLAGTVQIVARVLEVALHKAHTLGFPVAHIIDGFGCAPIPAPAPDFLTAMGRTNDAILFAGQVHLFVDGKDADAESLCERLPSAASRDFGRPFAEVFKDYDYDFFQIDPMLFSPADVIVSVLQSGRSFRMGAVNLALLGRSLGISV